jgi:hypothetical protein
MKQAVVENIPEELFKEFECLCVRRSSSVGEQLLVLMKREVEKARKSEIMSRIKKHIEGGDSS